MHGSAELVQLSWLAALMLSAALSITLSEKLRVPAVLGFLLAGFGARLALQLMSPGDIEQVLKSEALTIPALMGSLILLYEAGMHTSRGEMLRVGPRGGIVAVVGVIIPLVVMFLVFHMFWDTVPSLFAAATFVATSVGITAEVFKGLGVQDTYGAKIVLAAGVIDDVLGLIVLAVVERVATTGEVSVGGALHVALAATIFVVVWVAIGEALADLTAKVISRVAPNDSAQLTFTVGWCLFGAITATWAGLSPIIGAFAAGMSLMPQHASRFHASIEHLPELTSQLSRLLVPVFFLHVGMQVDPATLSSPVAVLIGLLVGLLAVATKMPTGFLVGQDRWTVALGMAPRGEVGLVFLAAGLAAGVFDSGQYSTLMVGLVASTIIPLLVMPWAIGRDR